MDYELVTVAQLNDEQLKQLAKLHYSVMHTLLSDLGLPVVLRYYQIAYTDPTIQGICLVSPSGELLGWAMGSPHPDMINSKLRTPLPWFLLQMLRLAITHPLILWQLLTSVVSSSNELAMEAGAIELTYIGVAASQREKGLGKQLLAAFIEASHANGYHSVVLSVEEANAPAIALYEKAGFKIIKTFSEGRYQRQRMELTLA